MPPPEDLKLGKGTYASGGGGSRKGGFLSDGWRESCLRGFRGGTERGRAGSPFNNEERRNPRPINETTERKENGRGI